MVCRDLVWRISLAESDTYLGCRRGSWHQWFSRTGLGWWATDRNGSLAGWQPWSAGRPPGSQALVCAGFFHFQAHSRSLCDPSAHLHGLNDHLRAHNSWCFTIHTLINHLIANNQLFNQTPVLLSPQTTHFFHNERRLKYSTQDWSKSETVKVKLCIILWSSQQS